MKRVLFVFNLLILLTGCILNPEYLLKNYIIYNNSSGTVSFSLKNYDSTIYTISAGASMTKRMYGAPSLSFTDHPRVTYSSGMEHCKITDLPSWTIQIKNGDASQIVTISEKNNMLNSWGDVITLSKDGFITAKLYTQSPVFTVLYGNEMPAQYVGLWENGIYKLSVQ